MLLLKCIVINVSCINLIKRTFYETFVHMAVVLISAEISVQLYYINILRCIIRIKNTHVGLSQLSLVHMFDNVHLTMHV